MIRLIYLNRYTSLCFFTYRSTKIQHERRNHSRENDGYRDHQDHADNWRYCPFLIVADEFLTVFFDIHCMHAPLNGRKSYFSRSETRE